VSAVRFSQAKVTGTKGTKSVVGIDPATIASTYRIHWRQGSTATLAQLGTDGVLVDKHFGGKHHVGERLHLFTPAGKHVTYTVRGLLDEGNFGLLGGGLVVPNSQLTRAFNDKDDDFVFLRFAPGANGMQVRASIDHLLDTRFPIAKSQNRQELKDDQAKQVNQLLYLIYALLALSVIVSLFGIVNTLALSVVERTREIGMLRAVGMTRRQTRRMVRHESIVTALIGATLGAGVGLILGAMTVGALNKAWGLTFQLPVGTLVAFVIIAVVAGTLAAIAPARRAAKLDVLEALQYV
jgi:putative ABC transport system permease protein